MKTILLTFDLEEFDLPLEFNQKINQESMYKISELGLTNILKLLEKYNIKATFFTTGNFAKKYPEIIKELSKKHEIACHGYSHSEPIILESIKKAKQELEKITGKKVKGFRAPRWDLKDIILIKKIGFEYDSSSHPIFLPGRYSNLNKKRNIHKINNMLEIPLSTLPPNLSLFWLAFKNFPLSYAKIFTKLNFINSNYTMLIFHPWEFANLSKINIPNYIKRKHSHKLLNHLEKYIIFCKKNKYRFDTVENYLKPFFS